jgi:hypothetical protein
VRRTKQALSIPLIASLNGATPGGWVEYAAALEQAGADALELNLFDVPLEPTSPAPSSRSARSRSCAPCARRLASRSR